MKRFFIDRAPELAPYAGLSAASADIGTYIGGMSVRRRARTFTYLVLDTCSALIGVAAGLAAWGIAESAAGWLLFGLGAVATTAAFRGGVVYLRSQRRLMTDSLADLTGFAVPRPSRQATWKHESPGPLPG